MPGQLIDINSKLDGLTTRQVMVAPRLCRRPRSSAATAGRPVDTRDPVRDSFRTTTIPIPLSVPPRRDERLKAGFARGFGSGLPGCPRWPDPLNQVPTHP